MWEPRTIDQTEGKRTIAHGTCEVLHLDSRAYDSDVWEGIFKSFVQSRRQLFNFLKSCGSKIGGEAQMGKFSPREQFEEENSPH